MRREGGREEEEEEEGGSQAGRQRGGGGTDRRERRMMMVVMVEGESDTAAQEEDGGFTPLSFFLFSVSRKRARKTGDAPDGEQAWARACWLSKDGNTFPAPLSVSALIQRV